MSALPPIAVLQFDPERAARRRARMLVAAWMLRAIAVAVLALAWFQGWWGLVAVTFLLGVVAELSLAARKRGAGTAGTPCMTLDATGISIYSTGLLPERLDVPWEAIDTIFVVGFRGTMPPTKVQGVTHAFPPRGTFVGARRIQLILRESTALVESVGSKNGHLAPTTIPLGDFKGRKSVRVTTTGAMPGRDFNFFIKSLDVEARKHDILVRPFQPVKVRSKAVSQAGAGASPQTSRPPGFTIAEFTDEQAQALCDFIIRREPARLSDLAHWMHDTGGPVELMDASLDSLVPLWSWFISFVNDGCRGVPDDARPESFQRFGGDPFSTELAEDPALYWKVAFAAESLDHYILQVVRRLDPTAHWGVYFDHEGERLHIWNSSNQSTVIQTSWTQLGSFPMGTRQARRVLQAKEQIDRGDIPIDREAAYIEASWLHETTITSSLSAAEIPASQARQASVLLPYLSEPRLPWDAPERIPPRLTEDVRTPAMRARADVNTDYGHWLIARRPPKDYEEQMNAGVEEQSLYPPMDAELLAAGLAELGYRDKAGQSVTAATLLDQEGCMHPDQAMGISCFLHDGTVRQLWVEGIALPRVVSQLKRDMKALAKSLGAELSEGH